jgi:hypothetical protein
MVHTIVEYAKGQYGPDSLERAVVEVYAEQSDILVNMPFKGAPAGVYRYMEEGELPDNMAFRALNEIPQEGHGLLNDVVEQTFPIAGNIDVDRRLIARHGEQRRAIDIRMSLKKKAKKHTDTVIFGDNGSAPREFTGLKARLRIVDGVVDGTNYRSRVFANSTASGGAALSLSQLDRAIGLVENPTHILMPKALKDRLPAATRDTGVSGFVGHTTDSIGRPVMTYNDLPILTGYGIGAFGEFLGFNEVGYGGGAAATSSIYVVRFGEDGVCGLEQQPIEVTDFGLLENGVHHRVNLEHDIGMCIEDPFSAIRMSSITNAAIVK